MQRDKFLHDVLANPNNRAIFDRWGALDLPDAWLVAGCLFQTIWNLQGGFSPEAQIRDYDLFYFDDTDLTSESEQRAQGRMDDLFADLHITIEVKNQARVHLWYGDHFGHFYPQLRKTQEGIDRFLITATCVGIRRDGPEYEIYAPYGLELVYDDTLSSNPLVNQSDLFRIKAHSYVARWPWLQVAHVVHST